LLAAEAICGAMQMKRLRTTVATCRSRIVGDIDASLTDARLKQRGIGYFVERMVST